MQTTEKTTLWRFLWSRTSRKCCFKPFSGPSFFSSHILTFVFMSQLPEWRTRSKTPTGRRQADGGATRRAWTLSLECGRPHTSPTSLSRASSSCDALWTPVSEGDGRKRDKNAFSATGFCFGDRPLNVFLSGVMIFDCEEKTMASLAERMVGEMVKKKEIRPDDREGVLKSLCQTRR